MSLLFGDENWKGVFKVIQGGNCIAPPQKITKLLVPEILHQIFSFFH